jgi:hypothetical protein
LNDNSRNPARNKKPTASHDEKRHADLDDPARIETFGERP